MSGPVSQIATVAGLLFSTESPLHVFSDKVLHQLGAMDIQKTAQGFKEQIVFIPEPALSD
jgi:hypothetical protein